jgi:hypothetical protein
MKKFTFVLAVSICLVLIATAAFAFPIDSPETKGQGKTQVGVNFSFAPPQNGGDSNILMPGIMVGYGITKSLDVVGYINQVIPSSTDYRWTELFVGCNWNLLNDKKEGTVLSLQPVIGKELSSPFGDASPDLTYNINVLGGKRMGVWFPYAALGYQVTNDTTHYQASVATEYDFSKNILSRIEYNYMFGYNNSGRTNYMISGSLTYIL